MEQLLRLYRLRPPESWVTPGVTQAATYGLTFPGSHPLPDSNPGLKWPIATEVLQLNGYGHELTLSR